jgi:oligosaccharide repeat unit polymerase
MTFILIISAVLLSVVIGRILFRSLFNPIAVYAVIWGVELLLYEWRLIRYYDLSTQTWVIILAAYFCFLMGVLTISFLRKLNPVDDPLPEISTNPISDVFDRGRILHFLIYTSVLVGLIGAVQHWLVLLNMFGSLVNIFLNAPTIYMMRVQGQIHGVVPYLATFSYVAAFLSGIYMGKKGKWHPGTLLAFLGVVLEDTANVARAGMLLVFLEFFTVVVLCRMGLEKNAKHRATNKKLIFSFLTLFIVLAAFATAIKTARTVMEEYKSASRALNKMKNSSIITPTVYMYFSCQTGVLNKYLAKDDEKAMWGENTFLPVYNLISKTGIIKHPSFYQKGYFVPMWSNTGTYLREIHADFGYPGLFLVPYLLGLGITYFWYRYFKLRRMNDLLLLVYFMLVLYFSFLVMITRLGHWWISLVLLLIIINVFESLTSKRRPFLATDAS